MTQVRIKAEQVVPEEAPSGYEVRITFSPIIDIMPHYEQSAEKVWVNFLRGEADKIVDLEALTPYIITISGKRTDNTFVTLIPNSEALVEFSSLEIVRPQTVRPEHVAEALYPATVRALGGGSTTPDNPFPIIDPGTVLTLTQTGGITSDLKGKVDIIDGESIQTKRFPVSGVVLTAHLDSGELKLTRVTPVGTMGATISPLGISVSDSSTSTKSLSYPTASGTIALTSDITDAVADIFPIMDPEVALVLTQKGGVTSPMEGRVTILNGNEIQTLDYPSEGITLSAHLVDGRLKLTRVVPPGTLEATIGPTSIMVSSYDAPNRTLIYPTASGTIATQEWVQTQLTNHTVEIADVSGLQAIISDLTARLEALETPA